MQRVCENRARAREVLQQDSDTTTTRQEGGCKDEEGDEFLLRRRSESHGDAVHDRCRAVEVPEVAHGARLGDGGRERERLGRAGGRGLWSGDARVTKDGEGKLVDVLVRHVPQVGDEGGAASARRTVSPSRSLA